MKRICLSVTMLLCFIASYAQWRSTEDASMVASSFLAKQANGIRRLPANAKPQLAFTRNVDNQPLFYVFNLGTDAGYVLVSGNEASPVDVLGYATHGTFRQDKMPCGLEWLMDNYAEEIAFLAQQPQQPIALTTSNRHKAADHSAIAPLIQTRWGQDYPFNAFCPTGCPTGCVPTAVAQVCKFYQSPTQGQGNHTYVWNGQILSADFGTTTYQWDKMKLDYSQGGYTSEQAEAVATLLSQIGISIEVNYGDGGSSGSMRDALLALKNYFGYDNDMNFAQRTNYTDDDWNDLIYNELSMQRPIIYEGNGGAGGHAFIVDGYLDGLYHVNWGWEGYDDGYFNISSLVPSSYAWAGGFNNGQTAYLSVMPEDGLPGQAHGESLSKWVINKNDALPGDWVCLYGLVISTSVQTQDFSISAVAIDQADGTYVELENINESRCLNLELSYYFTANVWFTVPELTPGHTYEIHPTLKQGNTYTVLPVNANEIPVIKMPGLEVIHQLDLADGKDTSFRITTDKECELLTYTRNFKNTNWQPLYVPFSMEYKDWAPLGLEVGRINGFYEYDDDENGTIDRSALEIIKVKNGKLMPNHPYMIRATSTGMHTITLEHAPIYLTTVNSIDCRTVETEYVFTGTYDQISQETLATQNSYVMSGGSLKPSAGVLNPYRWYMNRTSRGGQLLPSLSEIKVFVQGEQDADAIDFVQDTTTAEGQTYNLMGQKVSRNTKGITIINGKKYINLR